MKSKIPEKRKLIEIDLIYDLVNLLKKENLSNIEFEKDNLKIRISRIVNFPFDKDFQEIKENIQIHKNDSLQNTKNKNINNTITSPMVGTVYLSPYPGAQPFIKIGQKINEGQPLLIIEAMKTMNQIAAPYSGLIKDILVKDAQPIEFGEPLVIID